MKTPATNSSESKQITDNFLNTLTGKQAYRLLYRALENEGCIYSYAYKLAHKIGAGSYYYDLNTNKFPSEIIQEQIVIRGINWINKIKGSA